MRIPNQWLHREVMARAGCDVAFEDTTSLIHWVRVVQQYRVAVTSFGLLAGRSGRHQYCLQILFTRYLLFSNNLVHYFTTLSPACCEVSD